MKFLAELFTWLILVLFDILGYKFFVTDAGTLIIHILFSAWPVFAFGLVYRLLSTKPRPTGIFVLISFISHLFIMLLVPLTVSDISALLFDDVSTEGFLYGILCFACYAVEYLLCRVVHPNNSFSLHSGSKSGDSTEWSVLEIAERQ